jgi:hypothetical protein
MTRAEDHKMKRLATLIVAPLSGLVYVIALPFIAVVMVITLVAEKIIDTVVRIVIRTVSYGWRPTESYLTGKKKKKDRKR